MKDEDLSFIGHLAELRKRLIFSGAVFLAASAACFAYAGDIVEAVKRPAGDLKFVFLGPAEFFLVQVKLSLIAGLTAALPFVLLQVWGFVAPALTKAEKRAAAAVVVFGTLLFAAGAVFAYAVVVPFMLRFFLSFSAPGIEPALSIGAYVDFVLENLLAFGAAFELPLAAAALGTLGILSAETLARRRSWALLGILILAAVLTPPDVVSQVLLALPLFGLYELSILALRGVARVKRRPEGKEKKP